MKAPLTLTLAERLEANAIIDRLVDNDTPSFDQREAARLLALIPCQSRRWWPSLSLFASKSGGSVEGAAAGVGQVALERDRQTYELTLGGDVLWRVGGYKVTHIRGELTISLMMEVDPIEGLECYLCYRDPERPDRLELPKRRELTLGPLQLAFSTRQVWKRPAE